MTESKRWGLAELNLRVALDSPYFPYTLADLLRQDAWHRQVGGLRLLSTVGCLDDRFDVAHARGSWYLIDAHRLGGRLGWRRRSGQAQPASAMRAAQAP